MDGGTAPQGIVQLSTTIEPGVFEGGISCGQDASGRFRVQGPGGRDGAVPFHPAIANTSYSFEEKAVFSISFSQTAT